MKIVTFIYSPNAQTENFLLSCAKYMPDTEVINAGKGFRRFPGNGEVIRTLYNTYRELDEHVLYMDGGDSFITYSIEETFLMIDMVVYSTEKASYPDEWMGRLYPHKKTPWCYLNGGGYFGHSRNVCEFMERYGLSTLSGDVNGQREQKIAYLCAEREGFNIVLDQNCVLFQSIAFADPDDFSINEHGVIMNNVTLTHPTIFHGNGRTPMDWIYNLHK